MKRWISAASIALACLLLVGGVVLAFANPTISHTADGTYECFAPYDTVLLGSRDNVGEHPDAKDIEQRCYTANEDRFTVACVLVGLGVLIGGIAVTAWARRRER